MTCLYGIDQDINSEGYSLGSVSPPFEIYKIHCQEGNGPNHGVPCFINEKFLSLLILKKKKDWGSIAQEFSKIVIHKLTYGKYSAWCTGK